MFGRISRGTSLNEVLRVYDKHWPFILHSKDVLAIELATMCKELRACPAGQDRSTYSLSDGAYDETAAELHYRSSGNLPLLFFQYLLRLQLACLFGRYEDALALSDKGEAVIRSAFGFTQIADHYLYRGLAAAVALTAPDGNAARHRRTLRHCLNRLHVFAANCPQNFRQHEALLQAEAARVKGQLCRRFETLQPGHRAGGGGRFHASRWAGQ